MFAALLLLGACTPGEEADTGVAPDLVPWTCTEADPWCMVVLGWAHACALDPLGAATCWGLDLGYESLEDVRPDCVVKVGDCGQVSLLPHDERFQDLEFGDDGDTVCGLTLDGRIVCWGAQMKLLSREPDLEGAGVFVDFAVGGEHACGVYESGDVRCWGEDVPLEGEDATGSPADLAPSVEVISGNHHACALASDGAVRCWGVWGANLEAEMKTLSHETPDGSGYTDLVSGFWSTACARDSEGLIWCWGNHSWCDVGDPICFESEAESGLAPIPGTEEYPVFDVLWSPGALTRDGRVIGGPDERLHPWPGDEWRLRTLRMGFQGGCGVVDDGGLLCWGSYLGSDWDGDDNSLGDGWVSEEPYESSDPYSPLYLAP